MGNARKTNAELAEENRQLLQEARDMKKQLDDANDAAVAKDRRAVLAENHARELECENTRLSQMVTELRGTLGRELAAREHLQDMLDKAAAERKEMIDARLESAAAESSAIAELKVWREIAQRLLDRQTQVHADGSVSITG